MDELRVMPKPDWVSWEAISEVLRKANEVNVKRGFSMPALNLPPEKLEHEVADGGLCVVALMGDKLVGVSACNFQSESFWFNKNKKCAYKCLTGILKSYQGCGILDEIDKALDDYIKSKDCDMIVADTAEMNTTVRINSKWGGYKELAYESYRTTKYYSVIFAKWLTACPYPEWYIKFRFSLSRLYVKTRYKVGKIERFSIIKLVERIRRKLKKLFLS